MLRINVEMASALSDWNWLPKQQPDCSPARRVSVLGQQPRQDTAGRGRISALSQSSDLLCCLRLSLSVSHATHFDFRTFSTLAS